MSDFGEILEISGKFRGTQWGFVWRSMYELSGIPQGFQRNARFSGNSGVWGGFG